MSLDFALKDFYRKKGQTFPFVITISLVIALSVFLNNISNSLNLLMFLNNSSMFTNPYFFSGGINLVYSQFNLLILILVLILAIAVTFIITNSFIVNKMRDISIMKSLGTLPEKLYGFYLLESMIIYLISYGIGWLIGILSYIIFIEVYSISFIQITVQIDLVLSSLLFLLCLVAVWISAGLQLKKIGKKNSIQIFSRDIPYKYDASQALIFIPKWLASKGINWKYSIINTMRKKSKFRRFFVVFVIISLIIFTIGLGSFVLNFSSKIWVSKSQDTNILAIGHKEVISNYSDMYEMYSNPDMFIDDGNINFSNSEYMFNFSTISQIELINGVEKIDQRLIKFCRVEELKAVVPTEGGGFILVGQDRRGTFPVIGVNESNLIQDFEIEGKFFDESDKKLNITIGDGLAYNFFEYPFNQRLLFNDFGEQFSISGILIDTFYAGFSAYIDIDVFRNLMNDTSNQINIILCKVDGNNLNNIKNEISSLIESNLGLNFAVQDLSKDFTQNLNFIDSLSFYSIILIGIISLISIYSLYHFQKGDLTEKLKDFLIMRALGSKLSRIRRILFLESVYVLIPALLTSLAGGMILNSIILFERVYLPPLYLPFLLGGILLLFLLGSNYLVLIPILKKIDHAKIRDLSIF